MYVPCQGASESVGERRRASQWTPDGAGPPPPGSQWMCPRLLLSIHLYFNNNQWNERERERLDDEGEEGEEGEEGGRKKSLKSAPCKRRMGWNGVEWGGVGWSGLYYSFFGCYHAWRFEVEVWDRAFVIPRPCSCCGGPPVDSGFRNFSMASSWPHIGHWR